VIYKAQEMLATRPKLSMTLFLLNKFPNLEKWNEKMPGLLEPVGTMKEISRLKPISSYIK